ncbi:hypothetical protein BDV93DRAFT_184511 [Ceratobasidium sp. AG-I]|nr:hypothetical protein BDV93DRAFT_184511 [Ceratobasidium sp. AG-I]
MLAKFEVLETFELTSIGPSRPSWADVILWLDSMTGLSSWSSILPSLRCDQGLFT